MFSFELFKKKPTNLAIAIAFLLICGSVSTFADETPLPLTLPENVGLSSKRLERIDRYISPLVEKKQIGGIVALVARHGKIAYFKAFGLADSGNPMKKDTLFRIASMTKPLTALSILLLYEEGRLLLTDPIAKYIPEFKHPMVIETDANDEIRLVRAKKEITIKQCLSHTSGLSYMFLATWYPDNKKLQWLSKLYKEAGIVDGIFKPDDLTMEENVRRLAAMPLYDHPGETYLYSLSFDVLGRIVEVVSGMTLEQFMTERIFKPLQMNDTHFYLPEQKASRLSAVWKSPVPGRESIERYDEGLITESEYFSYDPNEAFHKHTGGFFSGGAGLISTVYDYYRFLQMLLNKGELEGVRMLSPNTMELMTATNFIGDNWESLDHGKGWKYGLGVAIQVDRAHLDSGSIGAYEWTGIYMTKFSVDPATDKITLFMFNQWPRTPLTYEIWDKLIVFSNASIIN